MLEKLYVEVPHNFLIYLKFKSLPQDDEFLDKNIPWINKISLAVFENSWSHRVILEMLSRSTQLPDLLFINPLMKLANVRDLTNLASLDNAIKLLESKQEDFLINEEKVEIEIFENLEKELENEDTKVENNKLDQEIDKIMERKEEVEEETQKLEKTQLLEDMGERIFGKNSYHYYLLMENQMEIFYDLINNKEIYDLKGLICEQEKTQNLLAEMLMKNWKEILSKIKAVQNESIIPSELVKREYVFYPKDEKIKSMKKSISQSYYELVEIPELTRANSSPKSEKKEKKINAPKQQKFPKEKEFKLGINRFKEQIEQVSKGALLNWIRNLEYEKIQNGINEGRILLENYGTEIQKELKFLNLKKKIQL
jgi:hypothetical protein